MPRPDPDEVVARLAALAVDDLLALYTDLAATDAEAAAGVARALRDKARSGALDDEAEELIPVLVCCLVDAPSPRAVFHLAKALAAFGRAASAASPYLVERLDELHVTDDEAFWIFDGCLYALGYTGGAAARAFVERVAAEEPPRVVKAGALYRGELDGVERRARLAASLAAVRALLDLEPAPWRARLTELTRQRTAAPPKKTSPWMTRT